MPFSGRMPAFRMYSAPWGIHGLEAGIREPKQNPNGAGVNLIGRLDMVPHGN
jgi:hypothetical protein